MNSACKKTASRVSSKCGFGQHRPLLSWRAQRYWISSILSFLWDQNYLPARVFTPVRKVLDKIGFCLVVYLGHSGLDDLSTFGSDQDNKLSQNNGNLITGVPWRFPHDWVQPDLFLLVSHELGSNGWPFRILVQKGCCQHSIME